MKTCVIVPALNEEANIARAVRSARAAPDTRVVVVDGGSSDRTVLEARRAGADAVVSCAVRGRAAQMNCGARSRIARKAEVLMFLHADAILPIGYKQSVEQLLTDRPGSKPAALGAFSLAIDGTLRGTRVISWGANIRSRILGLPYGDQALFLRRKTFEVIGGFPSLPLLEDVRLVQACKKLGAVRIARESVTVSDRRWRAMGVLRTTVLNQVIMVCDFFHVDIQKLALMYRNSYAKAVGTGRPEPTRI